MNFLKVFILILLLPLQVFAADCVILLHGLARTDSSMAKLESSLNDRGFITVNSSYPSRKHDIETLANKAIPAAIKQCSTVSQIHFVTHSMGGILVRQHLDNNEINNLGHVVMLGPPNQGSEVVDKLADIPGFKTINGPAGLQLGTGKMSVPNVLGPANFSLGVIAGSSSINFILSTMLPTPNDGKVSVESTKLKGMSDHITMSVTHPFMMKNSKVIEQVIYFLENGKFDHASTKSSP